MGALERYDRWEASLDDAAASSGIGHRFEDHYDAPTLAAIVGRSGEPPRAEPRLAGRGAAAVVAGWAAVGVARGLHGVRDIDTDLDAHLRGEELPVRPAETIEAVTVILVPGNPAASVAIVRRWLL